MSSSRLHPLLALVALQICLSAAPVFSNEAMSDVPDALKIFAKFAYAVAVRDVNQDPRLKCITMTRIEYDPVLPSATYRWSLNVDGDEERKHPLVNFTKGSTPDRAYTIVNSDYTHPEISRFLFSDNTVCGVLETQFFGYQCTLVVVPEMKDSVPSYCLEVHAELCGESISLYDKDLCS